MGRINTGGGGKFSAGKSILYHPSQRMTGVINSNQKNADPPFNSSGIPNWSGANLFFDYENNRRMAVTFEGGSPSQYRITDFGDDGEVVGYRLVDSTDLRGYDNSTDSKDSIEKKLYIKNSGYLYKIQTDFYMTDITTKDNFSSTVLRARQSGETFESFEVFDKYVILRRRQGSTRILHVYEIGGTTEIASLDISGYMSNADKIYWLYGYDRILKVNGAQRIYLYDTTTGNQIYSVAPNSSQYYTGSSDPWSDFLFYNTFFWFLRRKFSPHAHEGIATRWKIADDFNSISFEHHYVVLSVSQSYIDIMYQYLHVFGTNVLLLRTPNVAELQDAIFRSTELGLSDDLELYITEKTPVDDSNETPGCDWGTYLSDDLGYLFSLKSDRYYIKNSAHIDDSAKVLG